MPEVTRRRMVWLLGMGAGAGIWWSITRRTPDSTSSGAEPRSDLAVGTSEPSRADRPASAASSATSSATSDTIATSTTSPTTTATTTTTTSTTTPATTATTEGPAATTTSSPPPPAVPAPSPVVVIPREGWGAAAPTGPYVGHSLQRMTVHHTAVVLTDDRQAPDRVRGHQRFHQADKGWPDLAYHFIIDRAGNVYQARPVDARGDTATAYDPTGHFLPCLEGDYDRQQPTEPQLASLVGLLAWAAAEYGLPVETLSGHRDHAATTCPGDSVYARLDEVREAVAGRLASSHTALQMLTGSEARRRVAAIET